LTRDYDWGDNGNRKALGTNTLNVKSLIHRARLFQKDELSDDFPMDGENNLHPPCMDLHLDIEITANNASRGLKNFSRSAMIKNKKKLYQRRKQT
jgi:hypothetical protein